MKKLIAATLILLAFFAGQAVLAAEKEPLDLPVKTLYSTPAEDSNVIYDIPVEVKLLDISEDGNWHKVKISFYIGPFGYTYVGWANIPVAKVLAERDEQLSNLASLLEEDL